MPRFAPLDLPKNLPLPSATLVGRLVATVAEICFAAQWAIALYALGSMTGAQTTLNAAWLVVPLILIAECFSWYAVLTTNHVGSAVENSIWAVAYFAVGIGLCRGAAGFRRSRSHRPCHHGRRDCQLSDIPRDRRRAWRAKFSHGGKLLRSLDGLREVSARWVVTHDFAEWKDEIVWMSLYFSAAVWASLALCLCYSLDNHLHAL